MIKFPSRRAVPFTAWLIWCLLAGQFFLSGCEPVRRKFIRKKPTATIETTAQPVFEPEEYPAPVLTSAAQYQGHYDRVLIWNKEVLANMEAKSSDKRILFSLKKCLKELGHMDGFLSGDSRTVLRQVKDVLEKMEGDFSSPAAYRPYQSYVKDLLKLDSRIRQTLKTSLVQDHFQP